MAGASAKFEVLLTEGAEQNLEAIYDYISEFDCVGNAIYVLDGSATTLSGEGMAPDHRVIALSAVCP
jgi:toxin ParE1/3/4